MIGLRREPKGVAMQVLQQLEVEPRNVRDAVDARLSSPLHHAPPVRGLTPAAKKAIHLSAEEAQRICNTASWAPSTSSWAWCDRGTVSQPRYSPSSQAWIWRSSADVWRGCWGSVLQHPRTRLGGASVRMHW